MLTDSYKHQGMRRKLIDVLHREGIEDERILTAMQRVPRHFFFEKAFVEKAYENIAFPIGEDQTISQPYTVAYQTQLLQIKPGDVVLEIGTGSGYQAAILATLGAKVVTIERNRKLHEHAKKLLVEMGYNNIIHLFGDGYEGSPNLAPFNGILVTAAAPYVPPALLDQLAIGGRLIVPVGNEQHQQMWCIEKLGSQNYETTKGEWFKFVPLLKGKVF